MRIHMVRIGLLVALSVPLAACAGGGEQPSSSGAGPAASAANAATYPQPLSPDKRVTIRFENYNLAAAGVGRDATLKMIAEFEREHPNIKVETKATGSQEIFPSIQAQLVAGTPPDLAQLLLREWDLNVEFLQPRVLTEVVPPDELQAHFKGEHPLHPRGLKLTERKGKLQGIAYVFSTPTLFYNADLFRAAGLDPSKPPKTWEEVKAAGDQIKQRTGNDGVYVACIENDWCAQGLLYSAGGRIMDEPRARVSFGEAPSVEWFRFWQGMVKSGAHPNLSEKDAGDAFQAGKLGMLLQTSAVQGTLLSAAKGKYEVRATGQPSFGGRTVIPVNSGSALAILAKDPDKQRAAWELMKYLTSERAFTIITSEIGYLPLRTGILNDDRYLKSWSNRELILPNVEQMENLESTYSYPGQNHLQIRKLFLTGVAEILFEGKDAERTLREYQARAQDLMPKP